MAEVIYGFPGASASLVAGANITLSTSGGTITVIGAVNPGATTFMAGVSTDGNTAGTTGTVNNIAVFVGGQNITLSESKNGQSASISIVGPVDAQSLGMSNIGNTGGTSGVASGSNFRFLFAGGSNITLSQSLNGSSGTLTINGMIAGTEINPVASANISGTVTQSYAALDHRHAGIFSAGVSTFGNTAGSTAVLPGQLVFAGMSGISLSQSTNATNGMTMSILGNAGAPTLAYVSKSASYTAAVGDYVINVMAATTITLPTAVGITGKVYTVKNSNLGTVIVQGTGGQTIDGAVSVALAPNGTLRAMSDGANWIIL